MVEPDIFSAAFQEEPYDHYATLRRHAPVYQESRYGVYVLTRYADVDATIRDHETFRSGAGPTPMPQRAGGGHSNPLPDESAPRSRDGWTARVAATQRTA